MMIRLIKQTNKQFLVLLIMLMVHLSTGNAQCISQVSFDSSTPKEIPAIGQQVQILVYFNSAINPMTQLYNNNSTIIGPADCIVSSILEDYNIDLVFKRTGDPANRPLYLNYNILNDKIATTIPQNSGVTDPNTTLTVDISAKNPFVCPCSFSQILTFKQLGSSGVLSGSIGSDQTIVSGSLPTVLTNITSATNGYAYQWEQSANGLTWVDISGATAATYQPPVLTSTTYYRRKAFSGSVFAYSNVVTVTVVGNALVSIIPSSAENYIITHSPYENMTEVNSRDASKSNVSIVYYDGLGRPMQEVVVNGASAGKDLVRPIVYDAYGREDKTYLPYERSGTMGVFTANTSAVSAQQTFYSGQYGATDAAYALSQKRFEPSPLNRVVAQSTSGKSWSLGSGHTDSVAYTTNAVNEVKLWKMTGDVLSQSGYYGAAQLYITENIDADRRKTREFKDKLDNIVEKWQIDNSSNKLITTYVYDDFNRLRVVIPPKAQTATINSAEFNSLIYRYIYDNRGRLIEKQLPGADPERMVYDSRDRLVMYQDGNMKTAGKWKVTLYDVLNRPVVEGLVTCATTHDLLQTYFSSTNVNQTLSGAAYTLNTVTNVPALTANGVLSYTFYDDYTGWLPTGFEYSTADFTLSPVGYMKTVKGQVTGAKIKVLDGNEETANAKWRWTVTHYDENYRPIQIKQELYDGATLGKATVSTNFAFDGNPTHIKEIQTFNGATNTIALRYDYDHARRPIKIYHKLNTQAETVVSTTTYDGLGRAKTKTLGNNEAVNYAYNIRNWLTEIKASKFETQLYYNTSPSGLTTLPQWNGNITAATWKQNGGTQQNYRYDYDSFNRLTQGIHSGGLNESGITYDANGNITKLVRAGGANAATYTYTYNGNKLTAINGGKAYAYDANGNTTTDGMRDFAVSYNLLNLPKKVTKGTESIEYVYDAAGNKLAKKVNGAFVNFYAGSIVYKGDKTPEYVIHPEGLAQKNGATFDYQYNVADHLGNVRNVQDAAKNIVQTTDYYPFGLAHATTALNKNKYLYNGKELQNDVLSGTAFGQLDYGARFYDPVIGRWHTIDRFAEKYIDFSPYQYAANNPIKFIDLNGDSISIIAYGESWNSFKNVVNTGLEGQYRVTSKKGSDGQSYIFITSTENGGDKSKMTAEGQAFLSYMLDMTNGRGVANIELVYNSPNIEIGNFNTSQIDMGDVEQFNIGGNTIDRNEPVGATQQGKLTHEMYEQYNKQTRNYKYNDAHNAGIVAENAVNGNTRSQESFSPMSGTMTQTFIEKNGSVTTMSYKTGKVIMPVWQPKPKGLKR